MCDQINIFHKKKLRILSDVRSYQCDQKKVANYLLKLPKNDFTRKLKFFDTFTKLPKSVGDLGKIIVAKGFEKLPKVQ